MIRALANKRIDLSDEELTYAKTIEATFGKDVFHGLFETDNDGYIMSLTPPTNTATSMAALFFLMNVTINQRLRSVDTINERIIEDLSGLRGTIEEMRGRLEALENGEAN